MQQVRKGLSITDNRFDLDQTSPAQVLHFSRRNTNPYLPDIPVRTKHNTINSSRPTYRDIWCVIKPSEHEPSLWWQDESKKASDLPPTCTRHHPHWPKGYRMETKPHLLEFLEWQHCPVSGNAIPPYDALRSTIPCVLRIGHPYTSYWDPYSSPRVVVRNFWMFWEKKNSRGEWWTDVMVMFLDDR